MRLKKITDVEDLGQFKQVLDLQVVDGQVEAITVNWLGKELRITRGDTYGSSLKILMEEPKEEVTKYRVVGEYMGFNTVPKVFDDEYDAKQYIIEMNSKLPFGEEHTLSVESFVELVEPTKI